MIAALFTILTTILAFCWGIVEWIAEFILRLCLVIIQLLVYAFAGLAFIFLGWITGCQKYKGHSVWDAHRWFWAVTFIPDDDGDLEDWDEVYEEKMENKDHKKHKKHSKSHKHFLKVNNSKVNNVHIKNNRGKTTINGKEYKGRNVIVNETIVNGKRHKKVIIDGKVVEDTTENE